MIYAIQCGEGGPIKFGVAKNPAERLRELQTGCPERLRLLVSVNIQHRCERIIHGWLREERVRGEWFSPGWKAKSVLEDLTIRAAIGPEDQTDPDPDKYEREMRRLFPDGTAVAQQPPGAD